MHDWLPINQRGPCLPREIVWGGAEATRRIGNANGLLVPLPRLHAPWSPRAPPPKASTSRPVCTRRALRPAARKTISIFYIVLPILKAVAYNTVKTIHPNKGKPAAMLGRKASGPGVSQDSGVAR